MEFRENVKETLNQWLDGKRGLRSKLSQFLGVKPSYISQLTAGKNQLTLEQGLKVAHFFGLSPRHTKHWMNLVAIERAGTKELRSFFSQRAEKSRSALNRINERLQVTSSKQVMTSDEQARYYSSWLFGAVHILTTIPDIQTLDDISRRLSIPKEDLKAVLQFLKAAGLVSQSPSGTLKATLKRVHLESDSPLIQNHHAQWRSRAIQSLDRNAARRGLHFSSAMTLSREDERRVREDLMNLIQRIDERLPASREEECMVLNLDWFPI